MILLRPEEMKELDQKTMELGFPGILLMDTAGRGVAEIAARIIENNHEKILVFAGKGNNGGDGLVAARFLDMWGCHVQVITLAGKNAFQGDSEVNYKICELRGINITDFSDNNLEEIKAKISTASMVIDAMLGTGLQGDVRGNYSQIIDLINQIRPRVLAVDIPSGLNGADGTIHGRAIRADYTATMAYAKLGLCLYPGREYKGELNIIDLGIPENLLNEINYNHFMLSGEEAALLLPGRDVAGHKGSFGKIGVLGGSTGFAGAPVLAGTSALKLGCGLVKLAVPERIESRIVSRCPELTTVGLVDNKKGIVFEAISGIKKMIEEVDILAVGPGLGVTTDTRELIKVILSEANIPVVLDADGLNAITDLDIFNRSKSEIIITPHPGEMARLTGLKIKEVNQNRVNIARDFAGKYGVYLVLKGASTVIAFPDGRVYINPTGNDGMASAGSGDVLTGMIASLLGQGLEAEKAAVLGTYLHGLAGDIAAEKLTPYSLMANDITENIPAAIKSTIEE